MVRLSSFKLRRLQTCIREIYAHLDILDFPGHVVRVAARSMPSSFVSFSKISRRESSLRYAGMASCRQMEHVDAFIRHMHEHPILSLLHSELLKPHRFREEIAQAMQKHHASLRRNPYGTAVRISDVLPDRQFRTLPIFNDFFRLNEADYQLAIGLLPDGDNYATFTFNRDKIDFSEEEQMVLNLLVPHIEQAYRNAAAHEQARQAFAALERSNRSIQSYGLTYREEDVLFWVAQGKSNAETARILHIAPGTVKVHLERIYEKLGVENRTAAAAFARKHHSTKKRTPGGR